MNGIHDPFDMLGISWADLSKIIITRLIHYIKLIIYF